MTLTARQQAVGLGLIGVALGAGLLVRRRRNRHSFNGQTVLITGGSRGLGLELARKWGREGARVAICARTAEDLNTAAAELRERGCEVFAAPCDVTKRKQVDEFVRRVVEKWGAVDVLVNNAGIIQAGPLECMEMHDFRQTMDTHFWGALYMIRAVLPHMRRQGTGRIVNIASVGGEIAIPHLLPYSASKFALVGLSEGLHAELRSQGIHVTTVCPGLMRTGSPRNAQLKGNNKAEYAWFSISDSLPLLSISSRRAARRIVRACRRGRPHLKLSLPARLATRVHGLFPGATARLLSAVNRLLPKGDDADKKSKSGVDSFSAWSPSLLTLLTERAAFKNNELR